MKRGLFMASTIGPVEAGIVSVLEDAFFQYTGVHRYPLMYNDFLLLGPAADPAEAAGAISASRSLPRGTGGTRLPSAVPMRSGHTPWWTGLPTWRFAHWDWACTHTWPVIRRSEMSSASVRSPRSGRDGIDWPRPSNSWHGRPVQRDVT